MGFLTAFNMTSAEGSIALPPLPEYTLTPLPPVLAPIPDKLFTLLLPIAAYWAVGLFFHWIDVNDYLSKYRLHTPAEILKRNHVSRYVVVRDVLIQQVLQTIVGGLLGLSEPPDYIGKEDYDVAVWAQRIRVAQQLIPPMLALFSVDAKGLAQNLAAYPALAGVLSGGYCPSNAAIQSVPAFAAWELVLAKAIYWVIVPAIQFFVAVCVMDTWQYFWHRAMHMNKWLYTTIHSRHHRLYVPYAFGALYNHPIEALIMDIISGAISFKAAGLNTRQGMVFFTFSTIKTVDDHCGYALPWDPLQHFSSNNAGYHDVHHQSWGIKTNFSQPYFTFWDRVLGTVWAGGDVSARYERAALAAQRQVDADNKQPHRRRRSVTGFDASLSNTKDYGVYRDGALASPELRAMCPTPPPGLAEHQAASSRQQVLDGDTLGSQILVEEAAEEQSVREAQGSAYKGSGRRRTASSLAARDGLRGLRERVNVHGRTGGILGVEHAQ